MAENAGAEGSHVSMLPVAAPPQGGNAEVVETEVDLGSTWMDEERGGWADGWARAGMGGWSGWADDEWMDGWMGACVRVWTRG